MQSKGGAWPRDRTKAWISSQLELQNRWGHGIWVFRRPGTGVVGRGALRHVLIEGCDEVEVGYVVSSAFWNRGLATEIADALARLAFDWLGRTDVVAYTTPQNTASRRVLAKAGFAFEREFVQDGQTRVLYRRLASARWLSSDSRSSAPG